VAEFAEGELAVARADDVSQQLLALVVARQVAARVVRRDQLHQLFFGDGLGIAGNRGPQAGSHARMLVELS